MQDARFYKLLCCWCKEPPEAGVIFPLLKAAAGSSNEELDDEASFAQVTAALTTYTQNK